MSDPPANGPSPGPLRIGDWRLDPAAGRLTRGAEEVRLEARALRLLLELAEHAGQVVSIDALLDRVWAGVIVTPDSVYQAVAALRRLLGDDPRRPNYIATVPRLGYRMVARVEPWTEAPSPPRRARPAAGQALVIAAVAAAFAVIAVLMVREPTARARRAPAPVAVGVLPFLDMTPSMDQVILTDDITEGLTDQLAQQRGLRTTGFRAAILLRGKHRTPIEAARILGVAYVLDGTVRKEGERVRIAARLIRGDSGFVVWTQTYDRPLGEAPQVEAEIAGAVAKSLRPPT